MRDLGFVDAHVHLNDVEMARRLMVDHGMPRAVVFWGRNSTNMDIAKAARDHPDAFIPFISVSPERKRYRDAWNAMDRSLLRRLDKALRSGVYRGIGEISVTHFPGHGFPEATYGPKHPMMRGIMRVADRHDVPVLVHCEITDLEELSATLVAFPKVTVIWAHGGYAPYFIAKRMIERHPNLVFELSARTWRHHPRSPEYSIYRDDHDVWPRWLELIEHHPTRFVVGTDAAHHSLPRERGKISGVQRLLEQLTPATRAAVARDNIERIVAPKGKTK